jgi:hypothetical protein
VRALVYVKRPCVPAEQCLPKKASFPDFDFDSSLLQIVLSAGGFPMTRIAEAYFHLKPLRVSDELLQSLGQDVSAIAANAALALFDPASEIEILLESGSLKGRATVIGFFALGLYHAALGTYDAVAKYKDFKEGARQMVADARTYGDRVIEDVLKEKEVPAKSVYRTERRTMTPGKLLRVLKRREWLAVHMGLLSPADIERESAAIEALTSQVLADLPADQQSFVSDLLKALDASSNDDAQRRDSSQQAAPRPGRPQDPGNFQPELFTPGPHSLPPEGEFYARFKLSEWQSQESHLPQPSRDRPSPNPSAISSPQRDNKRSRPRVQDHG